MNNNTTTQTTDSTDATFASLIELGDPTPAPATADKGSGSNVTDSPAALPAAQVAPKLAIPGVTVDQEGVRRATADFEASKKLGFSLKPPVYTLGTLVNEWGVENFKKSRKEWNALPMLGDACADLIRQVNTEEREDILLDVPTLAMNPDGCLRIPGKGNFPLSQRAIEGLAHHVTPSGAKYLSECPADLRATNLNHWFERGYRVDARATKANGEGGDTVFVPKQVTVRTRNSKEGREAFAVCGPKYGAFDVHQLCEKIYGSLSGKVSDARCDVTYDGFKLRFDILFHTDVKPEKAVAGEIFKAGILVRTADDGSGSINVSLEMWRNLCLNLIIIDFDKVLVGKRRHTGKATSIEDKVAEFLATADEKIGYFSKAWSAGAQEDILEKYNLSNPRDVFNGLVLNGVVKVPGVQPDDMVRKLMNAWEQEQGYTKTAFINAITRAAHEETWKSWETVDDLESTAGEMLFEKNWNYCVPPKSATVEDVLGGF